MWDALKYLYLLLSVYKATSMNPDTQALTSLFPQYLSSLWAALMIRKCGTVSNLSGPPGLFFPLLCYQPYKLRREKQKTYTL